MRTLEELQKDVLQAYDVMVETLDILSTSGDDKWLISALIEVKSLKESLDEDYDPFADEYDKYLLEERRIMGNIEIFNKYLDKTVDTT